MAIVPASCQLSFQAGMRSAILYGQAQHPSSYPISYSMAVSSQEADLQWCGPKCGPRCGSLHCNASSNEGKDCDPSAQA